MNRRTVVITGATKGLGRATALEFARSGHRVIGTYSTDDDAANQMKQDLLSVSDDSVIVKHDVRDDGSRLWNSPEIANGANLTLVNNACAPFTPQPFHLLSWNDVQHSLDVGLKGSWLCSQGLLRTMVRQGNGTIVNVLTAAMSGFPPKGFAAYIATKHAIRGLTLALAAEYHAKGLRVFSVSPDFMTTSLTANWDARLVSSMNTDPNRTDPAIRAQAIRKLVEDYATIGRGEDYLI